MLQAALEVITEKGLDETRMADIGNRAGMSAGHVLYYFPSKADLLMQALQWSEDQFMLTAAAGAGELPTARARLWRLIEFSVPDTATDPGWIIWLETWARAPHDQRVARFQAAIERRWIGALTDVIAEGQRAGEFRDVDAEDFATVLSATIDGLAIRMLGGEGATMTRERLLSICARRIDSELIVAEPAR